MNRGLNRTKRSFTLIEVIISFCLISIGTVGLYSIYTAAFLGTNRIEKQLIAEREILANSRKVRHYVAAIILSPIEIAQNIKIAPFFYTEGKNGTQNFQVYAALDNGEDGIPALSNEVLSRFYISESGTFTVSLSPHPGRSAAQMEVIIPLVPHIQSILWEFSRWPRPIPSLSADAPLEGVWIQEWKKEWMNSPPQLVRLTLHLQNGETRQITSVQTQAVGEIAFERGG
ncbi:MAG: hypothetical protein QRY74_04550 [Chlamydia sp.]